MSPFIVPSSHNEATNRQENSADSATTSSDHVLIFTKYPTPGYAKTRLIPAVGTDRAADISRQLSERIVRIVRDFLNSSDHTTISRIYYAARSTEDASLIKDWLGQPEPKIRSLETFHQQANGDLGQRLSAAFAASFLDGANKVIVVGADIPEINGDLLAEAFGKLDQSDLVIGPAVDGGYYLLGLKSLCDQLFEDIPWSTEKVFVTTFKKAKAARLSVSELPTLRDVDLPGDIQYFENIVRNPPIRK